MRSPGPERGESPGYGRSAALLTGAVGLAGVLTYGFFALASHALSRDDYGRIVVLWSVMFMVIAVLFRPVEQLLSRTVADIESRGLPTGHALRVGGAIQLAIVCLFTLAALVFRSRIETGLFDGESLFFWALVASVLGWAAAFWCRGYLAGSGRFALYSAMVLIDAVARLAFALAVAVGIAAGPDPIAIGIALAPVLSLAVMPLIVRAHSARAPLAAAPAVGDTEAEFTLARGGGFAAAVLVVMLSEQALINSGPLIARADAGTVAAAGFIFNVLMLVRAPVVVFQAAATSLLPHLTRLRSSSEGDDESEFRRPVEATIRGVVIFATLTTLAVALAGPTLMQAAFGGKFEYERAGLIIVAVGMGLYLSAVTLNQAVLAQGRAHLAAICWAACAGCFVLFTALPLLDVFRRVEVGFAVAAGVLCWLLYLVYRHPQGSGPEASRSQSQSPPDLLPAAWDEML